MKMNPNQQNIPSNNNTDNNTYAKKKNKPKKTRKLLTFHQGLLKENKKKLQERSTGSRFGTEMRKQSTI